MTFWWARDTRSTSCGNKLAFPVHHAALDPILAAVEVGGNPVFLPLEGY